MVAADALSGSAKLSDIEMEKAVYVAPGALSSTKWLSDSKENYPVIGDGVLVSVKGYLNTTLVIPETVKRIPEGIFVAISAVNEVHIPESTRFIAKKAFTENYKYQTSTGTTAVGTKIRNLTIYGKKGSFAEYYSRLPYFTFKKTK